MNLPQVLAANISKKQVNNIVSWIGNDQGRFNELFKVFTNSHYRVTQRAAWPLSFCVIQHPDFIKSHYKTLIKLLKDANQPPAVKRNILRLFDQGPAIPNKYHGMIMDICFTSVEDPGETIASKAFAIGILSTLSDTYPKILPELKTAVELQLHNAPPGVRSRALKVLKKKASS